MSTLFSLRVNKLYDVVRRRQEGPWSSSLNYHVSCEQSFNCYWPRNYGSNTVDTAYSDHFYCPVCGEEVDATKFTANASSNDRVPLTMELSIVERRGQLDVVFKYDSVVIDGDFGQIMAGFKSKRTDIVRFDFKQREVRYIRRGLSRCGEETVIEPFKDREYYWLKTPFAWIKADYSCYLLHYRDELKTFCSILKKAYAKQLSKAVGYQIKGFRQHGATTSKFGMFASLFDNLSFRMAAPDGPSLSSQLIEDYEYTRGVSNKGQMADILALTKAGQSWIDACMQSLQITNASFVRRYVAKRPFLITQIMWFIEGFVTDINYKRRVFKFIMDSLDNRPAERWLIDGRHYSSNLRDFCRLYRHQKGEAAAVRLILANKNYYEMRDAAQMYFSLTRPQRKAFWTTKLKAREIHDYLVAMDRKSRIENIPVQNGKRYEMLTGAFDGYEFSLPKETHALVDIGALLHNCVATYAGRVVNGDTAIVTVRKDNKVVACIEVVPKFKDGRFNQIHQAKLFANGKVSKDPALNQAVIDWADHQKLVINCNDVRRSWTAI